MKRDKMNHIFIIPFFLFLFLPTLIFPQDQWKEMDSAFSTLSAFSTFIEIDKNNIPYVAYPDNYNRATVKKFNGSNWIPVGNIAFSDGMVNCLTMALDSNNIPYVAYTDKSIKNKATVMKFNGTSWVTVGGAGFTDSAASFTSISIDKNNVPYIAFRDLKHQYRASVMKFNGDGWEYVGSPGFSALDGCCAGAAYSTITFDNDNVPYVAYEDMGTNFLASVQKFDGINWVYVGNPGFAVWNASYTRSIVFDSENIPYIICKRLGKVTVLKFEGNEWIPAGPPCFSEGNSDYASIAIGKNDTLYVVYSDYFNGHDVTVMKYDGVNWVSVGSPGFTPSGTPGASYTTLDIDGLGNLYVAYVDHTPYYGGTTYGHHRGKVMKFEKAVSTLQKSKSELTFSFEVFPNPSSDEITFRIFSPERERMEIKIFDVTGNIIYSEKLPIFLGGLDKKIELPISSGIFLIMVSGKKNQLTKKIILE